MKTLLISAALALISSQVFAQTPDPTLATPEGTDISVSLGSYTYTEPGDTAISIHGLKVGGDFTGTLAISQRHHVFFQTNARGLVGATKYTGWCSPFFITPNSGSPNGYELRVGGPSPCTESGDKDWYVEARGLVGKDMIGDHWAFSPYSGAGLRYLSNGTTGTAGYRTDKYLYVPVGVTSRTKAGSHALSFTLEGDALVHGWQKTRDSELGGGDVPATPIAPAFTIEGFSDISFTQSKGWALRASAKYDVTPHLSLEPYYIRWTVGASPRNDETVTFTVNGITAREQLGAYEPLNHTNEAGVKLGFHF